MKTYLFIPANLFMIFIMAGCMIEDPLSEEERYEYDLPVLPKCEASVDFGWLTYSGQEERMCVGLVIQNVSTDLSAYDVQCDVSIIDDGSPLVTETISYSNIEPMHFVEESLQLVVINPKNLYKNVEYTVSWYDQNDNYYEVRKTGIFY